MIKDSVNKMDKTDWKIKNGMYIARKRVYSNLHKTYECINKKKKPVQNEKVCREKSWITQQISKWKIFKLIINFNKLLKTILKIISHLWDYIILEVRTNMKMLVKTRKKRIWYSEYNWEEIGNM